MKLYVVILKMSVLMILTCTFVFAQNPPNRENSDPSRGITREDITRRNLENRMRNMRNSRLSSGKKGRVYSATRRTKPIKPEFTDDLRRKLMVDISLKNAHSDFINQVNTGILKLIEFEDCNQLKKSKKRKKCGLRNLNVREFANGYSFRENRLATYAKADVIVRKGYLISGRHSLQSVIVDLGDVDIYTLNDKSSGVEFLTSFIPSVDYKKVDKESSLFLNGITAGKYNEEGIEKTYSYSKATKLLVNHTYAMRSIAYRPMNATPLPKDKDVLVVFRVIDVDEVGSPTILWKQLQKKAGMEKMTY